MSPFANPYKTYHDIYVKCGGKLGLASFEEQLHETIRHICQVDKFWNTQPMSYLIEEAVLTFLSRKENIPILQQYKQKRSN